jgi:hypothetical protein
MEGRVTLRPVSRGRILVRAAITLLTLVFVATTLSVAFAPQAFAQEKRRWFNLRELFTPRRDRVERRIEGKRKLEAALDAVDREKAKKRKKRAAPREPEVVVKEKAPDAKIVLVVGDFLGAGLAEGLAASYADNPAITVIDRTVASSGIVRDDVYDWPARIKEVVEKEKPAAILVMLGSNDRQQMRVGEAREPARSPAWDKEYQRRVAALAGLLAEGGTPYAWFGLPSFKFAKSSEDMLAFNEIYRSAVTSTNGQFVDVWDGFVDATGAFVSTGPDITGQPVRLRTSDGINFTRAGKRKLAFYAEKPLSKMLGLDPDDAGTGIASLPDAAADPRNPLPVDRTVPMSLDDPALDGGNELLGGQPLPTIARPSTESEIMNGMAANVAPGRADSFAAPAALAASPPSPAIDEEAIAATR